MRLEDTERDVLAPIPKPCVVGSNPTGGTKKLLQSSVLRRRVSGSCRSYGKLDRLEHCEEFRSISRVSGCMHGRATP